MMKSLKGTEVRLILAILLVCILFISHEKSGEGCLNEAIRAGSGRSAISLQNNTNCSCQFLCINTKVSQYSQSMIIPPNTEGALSVYFGTYKVKGIIIDKNGKGHGILDTTTTVDVTANMRFWIHPSDPGVPSGCQ